MVIAYKFCDVYTVCVCLLLILRGDSNQSVYVTNLECFLTTAIGFRIFKLWKRKNLIFHLQKENIAVRADASQLNPLEENFFSTFFKFFSRKRQPLQWTFHSGMLRCKNMNFSKLICILQYISLGQNSEGKLTGS